MNKSTLSSDDLEYFVTRAGEDEDFDAKGCIMWDNGAESAKLAKDIVAFANSRGGGAIVIGLSEVETGKFVLGGLTPDQARSFDTTKVSNWINGRFSPAPKLVCYQYESMNGLAVVIHIGEFDDIPIMCNKDYHGHANSMLLRAGDIYVRNVGASSSPLRNADQLRALINMATRKRREEFAIVLEGVLSGRSLAQEVTDEQKFEAELERIKAGLEDQINEDSKLGALHLVLRPGRYESDRWEESETLVEIVGRTALPISGMFPGWLTGTHVRDWGVCNSTYGYTWTLSRSGQMFIVRPYFENNREYVADWVPRPPAIARRQWLEFRYSLHRIFEYCAFAASMAKEYEAGESMHLQIYATGLKGRQLVTSSASIHLEDGKKSFSDRFVFAKTFQREEFIAQWRETCAHVMKRFTDVFSSPTGSIKLETMKSWIKKFDGTNT